jgi:hypothetical protein
MPPALIILLIRVEHRTTMAPDPHKIDLSHPGPMIFGWQDKDAVLGKHQWCCGWARTTSNPPSQKATLSAKAR